MKADEEITEWISTSGRKLKWLASQVPCRPESLSRWMAGRSMPSQVYRDKLADVTGIDGLRSAEAWPKGGA